MEISASLDDPAEAGYLGSPRPSGGIGRRARFRVVCPYGRAGSIPVSGTPGGLSGAVLRALSAWCGRWGAVTAPVVLPNCSRLRCASARNAVASLIKNHDRWYLQFFESDRKPTRKRVPLRTRDKRLASKLRRSLEAAYLLGEFDPWRDDPRTLERSQDASQTVSEALATFLDAKAKSGRAPNTIRAYRDAVGLWASRIGEETPLHSIRAQDVEAFVHDHSVSATTRAFRHRHVRAFLRWLQSQKILRRDPMEGVESPKCSERAPKAVTAPELEEICKAVRVSYRRLLRSGGCREGEMIWRIPLFRFAYFTGLRSSELARLRWRDVDTERQVISVHQQKNRKAQTVPLVRPALDVLKGIEGKRKAADFVFAAPGSAGLERSARSFSVSAGRAFTAARDAAKVGRPVTFHGLRHGFCTRLAEAGKSAVVIKEAARHSDISTSMLYVSLANEKLRAELSDVFG